MFGTWGSGEPVFPYPDIEDNELREYLRINHVY
jgi:hypothetical protein